MALPVITGFTVRVPDPLTPLAVAEMCAEPWLTAVASPLLFTVAIGVASELQVKVTPLMTFPWESLATAVNCWVCPTWIVAVGGETVTLATGGFTVRVAVPFTLLVVAVMCAVPCATAVASPLLFTVAIGVVSELQVKVTPLMMFPLESLATAVNCWVFPTMMEAVAGVTVTVATPPGGGCLELVDMPAQPRSKSVLKTTRDVPMANRQIGRAHV